jgi:anti-sigma regulatory factor (Ser/Thr protein kinase)
LGPQLEGIYKSGNYLLLLLNDILDLARIEANRFELFPAPCEPRRFLDDLAQVFRLRAEQKGLGLVCHYTDDLSVTLMADERRLRQICMNLLGNAIKFTEQGEVGIEASYREGTLHITIVDSGIGIEAGRMDELFTPFQQQGNNPYKQLGAGLGLAISRSLAEQMGGTLTAESRPGEGSRFHFSAPLPRSDERLAQISPPAEAIWADPPRDGVAAPIATQAMVDPASSRQLLSDEPSPLDDAEVEEALAKLPAATINALENALLGGNRKQLRALLLGLEDEQPELMATLREHVDNYDYPWLLERLPA